MNIDDQKYYRVGSNLGEHPMARAIADGLLPPDDHPIMRLRRMSKESHLPMVEGVVRNVGTIRRS